MFSKVAILATLSLALSVAAGNDYNCNTGKTYCCNQWQDAKSESGAKILAVIGAAAQGLTGQVGANCTPVTVIGAGSGADCTVQPVCCEKNWDNGAVVAGCNPINANV